MLIRAMTKEDLDEVLAVERESFCEPWTKNMFLGELSQEITVYRVAAEDDRVIGYMGMYHVADEGHITNVAVAKDFRRCGVAGALIASFLAYAQENRLAFLTLEVRRSNSGAIRLYEKYGFREIGVRPRYYENKEDALLMTRFLRQGENEHGK